MPHLFYKRKCNKILIAHVSFLIATLIWAAAGPIIKLTLRHIPPTTFLFLRFLIVCVVLLPYAIAQLSRIKVHTKDYLNLFLLGLFSQTAILLVFWSIKFTSVLDYTIISVLGVILSIYAGHHFFRDKVSTRLTFGVIVASLGTLLVIVEPVLSGNHGEFSVWQRLLGNVIAVVFNATWVMYVVWSKMSMGERSPVLKKTLKFMHVKPMKRKYPPSLIVTLSFYVGLITLIPFVLLEKAGVFGVYTFDLFSIDIIGIVGLLYMAIFSSIVAYILYQEGLERAHVTDSALYGYLSPVFTLPIAYVLLGEIPNKFMIIGSMFVALGVVIAESKKS